MDEKRYQQIEEMVLNPQNHKKEALQTALRDIFQQYQGIRDRKQRVERSEHKNRIFRMLCRQTAIQLNAISKALFVVLGEPNND
jgi:hypothetical protein